MIKHNRKTNGNRLALFNLCIIGHMLIFAIPSLFAQKTLYVDLTRMKRSGVGIGCNYSK